MTIEEAIDYNKNLRMYMRLLDKNQLCKFSEEKYIAIDMAIKALEQTTWVPVSERLPEEYGEYLITWTTSQSKRLFIGISEGEDTLEYDHEHNRFKFEWLLDDYIKAYPNVEVIAWMPLPEPFKMSEIPTGSESEE